MLAAYGATNLPPELDSAITVASGGNVDEGAGFITYTVSRTGAMDAATIGKVQQAMASINL